MPNKNITLIGLFAVPDHPRTCVNEKGYFEIVEEKMEISCGQMKVWVRGKNTIWFPLSSCYIDDDADEVQWLAEQRLLDRQVKNLSFSLWTEIK